MAGDRVGGTAGADSRRHKVGAGSRVERDGRVQLDSLVLMVVVLGVGCVIEMAEWQRTDHFSDRGVRLTARLCEHRTALVCTAAAPILITIVMT